LPVVDQIALDYQDRVRFIAVAGRSDYSSTEKQAEKLFSHLEWGLGDEVWALYGIPYQPVTILITGGDIVFDTWPGVLSESAIRERLDTMLAALT
jgi:hypothetical protein